MTDTMMANLIAMLSNDIILICTPEGVVREANVMAHQRLGKNLVGKPLPKLLSTITQEKGLAFSELMRGLVPGEISEPWELLFHLSRTAPLLVNVRGAALDNGWLLIGTIDSSHLTTLYHEVLTINNELTTLVRRLSKEQAQLSNHLARLLAPDTSSNGISEKQIAGILELIREPLITQTAAFLTDELPAIGIPAQVEHPKIKHQQQMLTTARRFHDLTQVATTLDWCLVQPEFEWGRRKLGPMGVTWQHLNQLIDHYFAAANKLREWNDGERGVLMGIAGHMSQIGREVYSRG